MKKLSLVVAAVVMAVGLAVSGGAFASEWSKPRQAHQIMTDGVVLLSSVGQGVHYFTVLYGGQIYACSVSDVSAYGTN